MTASAGGRSVERGCEQQVNIIAHQHIGMNRPSVAPGGLKHCFLEELAVFVAGEDGVTVVAAQDDMLGYAFGEIAGESGHFWTLAELFLNRV